VSKLIRIEGGKSNLTKTDLQALLLQYGVTSEGRQDRLQALARGARASAWWAGYRGAVSDTYLTYIGYEAGASFMRRFHGGVVPGLLQTREYAEVLTAASAGPARPAPIIEIRLRRQQELAEREDPPWQFYILDEAVIRRHVGIKRDPDIMPRQLRHIINVAERSERTVIRVIPFSAGAHVGARGPFNLFEFDSGLDDVLYLEGGLEASVLVRGDDPRVIEYRDAFEELLEDTLSAGDSLGLIRQVADELKRG
jgi:hypothetical protein